MRNADGTMCKEGSCKCFCHVTGEPQGQCCGRKMLTFGVANPNALVAEIQRLQDAAKLLQDWRTCFDHENASCADWCEDCRAATAWEEAREKWMRNARPE